jgi:hypothetical protein
VPCSTKIQEAIHELPLPFLVIPAQAGIHLFLSKLKAWIPDGMNRSGSYRWSLSRFGGTGMTDQEIPANL